jgi:uncharacterized protein
VKFWDSSAILPLLLDERASASVAAVYEDDERQIVWCLTEVETVSALARRERQGSETSDAERARTTLRILSERWEEVSSVESVRTRAIRLLGTHGLRATDALQLAAALVFCDEQTESLPFVCLDDRLSEAARKERFPVLP